MRYLIILLFLTGCNSASDIRQVQSKNLKFKAGEKVKILTGFYSDCDGYLVGHSSYVNVINPIYHYTVRADCPNLRGMVEIEESEDNLKEKE